MSDPNKLGTSRRNVHSLNIIRNINLDCISTVVIEKDNPII